ncbi:MAG: helix-turn-helix domain-containing protein [Chitinophagaceae bacterium]
MALSPDVSNHFFELAARFVNQTSRHVFLTGRAGTGKTTFLRYIREHGIKKMAVVAPTGVAAINAGGVTLHSFFQLPFGTFVPSLAGNGWNSQRSINNAHTLLKNLRLSNDRRLLIRELELLIIDEVSMLRADLLDAIDVILRHVRRRPMVPFGGIQVLFIGDLFQLPPVVNNEDWDIMKDHYRSPFFFDAQVLRQAPPLYLELKKIYRQHEADFISLLNNVRNNEVTDTDLQRLHQHYLPGFEQQENDKFITLTTHNAKADTINQGQLDKLPGKLYEFKAEISKEFNDKALPADMVLQLKEGAQVMFIKNDKGESRRYYNGKIATVSRIEKENIIVTFDDTELELEKEVWRNIRYQYNKETDQVEEEEIGRFTQYPIRLAWAITIHKSQGLTFDKAIIDAGAAFAPGQVYVALSRLTSLEGLILYSRVHTHSIQTDERVLAFTRAEMAEDALQAALQVEQQQFLTRSLLQSFDWTKLAEDLQEFYDDYEHRQIPDKNEAIIWAKKLLEEITAQQEMAAKFTRQLEQLIPMAPQDNYAHLHQRVTAASNYFIEKTAPSITSIKEHIAAIKIKQKTKKYAASLQDLLLTTERKVQAITQAVRITEGLVKGTPATELLQLVEEQKRAVLVIEKEEPEIPSPKAPKGETRRISLQLFREGKTAAEIAQARGMALSTIEGHLAGFVTTGDIEITAIVAAQKVQAIMKAFDELPPDEKSITPVKTKLGDEYSFSEIRAVLHHREWLQQQQEIKAEP